MRTKTTAAVLLLGFVVLPPLFYLRTRSWLWKSDSFGSMLMNSDRHLRWQPAMKSRLILFGTLGLLVISGAVWFCSSALGGTEYLGNEGVFFQQDASDCGVAALKMIFDRYGVRADYEQIRNRLQTRASGTDMFNMRELAREEGLASEGWRLAPRDLPAIPLPAILLVRRNHFVVMERVDSGRALILDPARGRLRLSWRKLLCLWHGETLLFYKPGVAPDRLGCWFPPSQSQERK